MLTGPNGVAGEWGHNPLPWAVPARDPQCRCYCGQVGCIETLVSGPGLARDHREYGDAATTAGPDAEAIAAAAAGGDPAAAATL